MLVPTSFNPSSSSQVHGDNHPQILGYWCAPHRIDVVSAKPEKNIEFVEHLLSALRRIVRHVMASNRAQGAFS